MKAGLCSRMFCEEGTVLYLCCLVRETLAPCGYFSTSDMTVVMSNFILFSELIVQIFLFILLKASWFTMLCWFLLCSRVTQSYTFIGSSLCPSPL